MDNERFQNLAAQAINDGARERELSARRLASRFVDRRGGFDPSALERLGEAGLEEFLSCVRDQVPFAGNPRQECEAAARSASPARDTTAIGWARERRKEMPWLLCVVLYATAAAVAVSAFGAIILNFTNV